MRTEPWRGTAVLVVATAALASGCSGDAPAAGTPVGCGIVGQRRLVGLLGTDAESTSRGTVRALRRDHRPLVCRTTGREGRSVVVTADHHPEPYQLPARLCGAGWVYAGSPEKYAPACQETRDGRSRTLLIARWQPYLVRVTVTRGDRDWAGDPEVALAMTRDLARELGVAEAGGSG